MHEGWTFAPPRVFTDEWTYRCFSLLDFQSLLHALFHFQHTTGVDRGQTISFPLAGVIQGWQEGLQLMKEGGKATLVIPSDLAYGEAGSGEVIPPGATLKFGEFCVFVASCGCVTCCLPVLTQIFFLSTRGRALQGK